MSTNKFHSYSFKTANTEAVEAIFETPYCRALVIKRVFFPKSSKEKLYVEAWPKGFASAEMRLERTAKANPNGSHYEAPLDKAGIASHLGLPALFPAFHAEYLIWEAAWEGQAVSTAQPADIEGLTEEPVAAVEPVEEDILKVGSVEASDPLVDVLASLQATASQIATQHPPVDPLQAAVNAVMNGVDMTAQQPDQTAVSVIEDAIFEDALCQMEPMEEVKVEPAGFGTL